MKNPFKFLNPNETPPKHIESSVLSEIAFLKFMMNVVKHFTSDMVKTGVSSIDNAVESIHPDGHNGLSNNNGTIEPDGRMKE